MYLRNECFFIQMQWNFTHSRPAYSPISICLVAFSLDDLVRAETLNRK